MKQPIKIIFPLLLVLLLSVSLSSPAFAITDTEVEAQVAAAGKEAVAGNVLIWFLCAVAFLKVSQKIDSFLSSLGINVGHTGGSMLSDAMIAMRAVKMATGSHSGSRTSAPNSGTSGASGSTGFFQGGLAGIVSRKVTSDAIRAATTQTSAVHSASASAASDANHTASEIRSDSTSHTSNETQPGGVIHTAEVERSDSSIHTDYAAMNEHTSHVDSFSQTEGIIQTDNTPIPGGTALPGDSIDSLRPEGAESMENRRPDEVIQTDNTPIPYSPAPPDSHVEPSIPAGTFPMGTSSADDSHSDIYPVDTVPVAAVPAGTPPADAGQTEGIVQTDNTPIPETPAPTDIGTPPSTAPIESIPAGSRPSDGVIQTDNTPIPEQAVYAGSEIQTTSESEAVSDVHTGSTVHTDSTHSSETAIPSTDTHTQLHTSHQSTVEHNTHYQSPTVPSITRVPSLGGVMFMRSLQSGGLFANDVIGTVARGDTRTSGTMTGDLAAQALTSYMSIPSPSEKAVEKVTYSQVEIGGGKITGKEITPEHPTGLAFSMYHVDQYAEPKGLYEKVTTVDGAQWYKQVAVDTLVKTPSKIVDGKVEYNQEIVKRLPDPPRRKDKI